MTYRDLFRVMLAHGVTRRQAYAVISELRGSDPVAQLEQHAKGAAFEAAVARLRSVSTTWLTTALMDPGTPSRVRSMCRPVGINSICA